MTNVVSILLCKYTKKIKYAEFDALLCCEDVCFWGEGSGFFCKVLPLLIYKQNSEHLVFAILFECSINEAIISSEQLFSLQVGVLIALWVQLFWVEEPFRFS